MKNTQLTPNLIPLLQKNLGENLGGYGFSRKRKYNPLGTYSNESKSSNESLIERYFSFVIIAVDTDNNYVWLEGRSSESSNTHMNRYHGSVCIALEGCMSRRDIAQKGADQSPDFYKDEIAGSY